MIIQCSKYFFISFNVVNGLQMSSYPSRSCTTKHKENFFSSKYPSLISCPSSCHNVELLQYKLNTLVWVLHKFFLFSKLIHAFTVFIGELFLIYMKKNKVKSKSKKENAIVYVCFLEICFPFPFQKIDLINVFFFCYSVF